MPLVGIRIEWPAVQSQVHGFTQFFWVNAGLLYRYGHRWGEDRQTHRFYFWKNIKFEERWKCVKY
jgi:hypothetical protein